MRYNFNDLNALPRFLFLPSWTCDSARDHQASRKGVNDATMSSAAGSVASVGRVQLKLRKTLKGHLAKIYAMHWNVDSRWAELRRWSHFAVTFQTHTHKTQVLRIPLIIPVANWSWVHRWTHYFSHNGKKCVTVQVISIVDGEYEGTEPQTGSSLVPNLSSL